MVLAAAASQVISSICRLKKEGFVIANRTLDLQDYLGILRRRWLLILIPAVVFPVLAYVGSLRLPNRYTSQTLVLVEQQKVPDSIVKPVVSEDLTQRLATMQEQILSRTRLQSIIEKYGLYSKELKKQPMEVVLDKMRLNIDVRPIKGDPNSRASGIPGFYISFTADDPHVAQLVCGQISSMFIDQNLLARQQMASGTTDFLSSQVDEAKRKLDSQDAALADFKSRYLNQLPDRDATNLTMLTSLNAQLDAITQSMTQASQQKSYMQSLLAQQVAAWKSKQVEGAGDPDDLQKRRAALEADLINLQAQYTADHPDVIRTKQALVQIDRKIAEANERILAGKSSPVKASAVEPTEIVQMRLSIRQLEDSIKGKTADQERLQDQIKTYQARIQLSPKVEEQYKKLTRDYQSAQAFYDDLLSKRRQSEMATELERDQQGEQFRVMDPPNFPEKASWPNRMMIVLGGLAAGLALGCIVSAILEFNDQSLRSEKDVMASLKLPTLVSIPELDHTEWNRHSSDAEQEEVYSAS
jgi:polysaccharide chain length determinant protein (PEP-CTERM system associated)